MTFWRRRVALSGLVFVGLAARFFEVLNTNGHLYSIAQHRARIVEEPSILKNEASRSKRRIDITPTAASLAEQDDDIISLDSIRNANLEQNKLNNSQQQLENNRPSLILHVGPHKTGTTTLQTDMTDHFTDVLAQDHYVYLGKGSEGRKGRQPDTTIQNKIRSTRCFTDVGRILKKQKEQQQQTANNNSTTTNAFPSCWIELQKEMDRYHQQNTSIILSDEDFSHNFAFARYHGIPHYFDALSSLWKDWNVIVAIGYRRYAEWAMSSVKQFQVGQCFRTGGSKHNSSGWKERGGEKCPEPFDANVIPAWMHRTPYPSARVYHSYQEHQQMWQEHTTFETRMLNFHSQEHLSTTLFCHVLTNTPHTCEYARNRPRQTAANKKSVAPGAYSNIALAAAAHGLVNTTTQTRQRLTNELQHYHQQALGLTFQHLPLKCPTRHQLQELLNISLAVEKAVMPDLFHAPGNIEEHERSFWRMAEVTKEVCSVDADALLQGVSSINELKERLKRNATATNVVLQ